MTSESRHLSEWIDRSAGDVYAYVSDPFNLPNWAMGLGNSVHQAEEQWFVETATGWVGLAFARPNELGVLDHYVTLPSGQVVYAPMRVLEGEHEGTSEVVFTVRRRQEMTEADVAADVSAVTADLARLKKILEAS